MEKEKNSIATRYSKEKLIEEFIKSFDKVDEFYKSEIVNWLGNTKDTNELYSEIISGEILKSENESKLNAIKVITRTKTYNPERPSDQEINEKSNREEEKFVKKLFNINNFKDLGKIANYQIPLKDSQKNEGVGKIDFASYNEETKKVFLVEVKYGENLETLLRAILEIETYFRQLNQEKFLNDFGLNMYSIRKAILLSEDCQAWKEFLSVKKNERPKTSKLMNKLGILVFSIKEKIDIDIESY